MKKKAQINHMFVYIFSIIVAGIVVLFGYYVIKEFSSMASEAKIVDFRAEIVKDMRTINSGDVKVLEYSVPMNVKEVCFVDLQGIHNDNPPPNVVSNGLKAKYPIVADNVEDSVKTDAKLRGDNMFLMSDKSQIVFSAYVGNVKLGGPNYYCKPVERGLLEIKAEGKGDGVSFASYRLVEVIGQNYAGNTLHFDNVMKGLSLQIPSGSVNPSISLIFEIKSNNQGNGISDMFSISDGTDVLDKTWTPPLELSIPVKAKDEAECTNKIFNIGTGDCIPQSPECIKPQTCNPENNLWIATYSISQT